MKPITRVRKIFMIEFGDEQHEQDAIKLASDIYDLSRNLYSYSLRFYHWNKTILTNDGLMQEFNIAREVLNYECDEVWVLGCDEAGCSMGGTNAFWIGSNPVRTLEHIHRRFPMMRFSDEPMLKTYARRVENTMYKVYEGYPPAKNMWMKFIRNNRSDPDHASCGTVIYPPNGIMEGYSANNEFLSDADDWLNYYPDFRDRVRFMNSSEWGGTQDGYLRWWLRHIPHGVRKTDGIHDNWWHYVMDLDKIKTP